MQKGNPFPGSPSLSHRALHGLLAGLLNGVGPRFTDGVLPQVGIRPPFEEGLHAPPELAGLIGHGPASAAGDCTPGGLE